jgi:hypothetical protein
MTTLDSDISFGNILRRASAAARLSLRDSDHPYADSDVLPPVARGGVAAFSIFAGLGIMSAVIFVTGYSALLSDTPAIWIHRLMALTVAQSILIGGIAMKLLPYVERGRFSVRIFADARQRRMPAFEQPALRQKPDAAVQQETPRRPLVGGKLAGREFLAHADGSIEIDTLVGRRRFVSLDAAREFVGA